MVRNRTMKQRFKKIEEQQTTHPHMNRNSLIKYSRKIKKV